MEKHFRKTNIVEKLFASIVNAAAVLLLAVPLFWIFPDWLPRKLSIIGLFFAYNLAILLFNKNRCLGMVLGGTCWDKEYSLKNNLIYLVLYTLSFSTLFFWVYFPFDLFLANMLLLQLPTVIFKGTTFHGLFSGNMATVKMIE